MLQALIIGGSIYLGGAVLTAGLMAIGCARDGEWPDRYDLGLLGCGLVLWPVTLLYVISVLARPGEPGRGEEGSAGK